MGFGEDEDGNQLFETDIIGRVQPSSIMDYISIKQPLRYISFYYNQNGLCNILLTSQEQTLSSFMSWGMIFSGKHKQMMNATKLGKTQQLAVNNGGNCHEGPDGFHELKLEVEHELPIVGFHGNENIDGGLDTFGLIWYDAENEDKRCKEPLDLPES